MEGRGLEWSGVGVRQRGGGIVLCVFLLLLLVVLGGGHGWVGELEEELSTSSSAQVIKKLTST